VTRDLCLQLSVHRSTSQPVYQSTVISCQSTSLPQTDNRKQKTHNSHLTTHNSLLHNYTIILTTNKPPLGLIEFSIQWLWSIASNPSLELTEITHDTCHFEWFSIENCIEKCFNVRYSIEFSIQWLWSIATNPSLELTGTTYYFTTILIHHFTPYAIARCGIFLSVSPYLSFR
jgi:hypothetical protein